MKTLSRFLLAALLAVASSVSAQSGSKIVFDAVANGQTGAMQTGAKAASVTLTFCGTGFSGNVYVDAAATQAGLAQVWTTALTGNSDCTTTYTKSPATKWYRVRWTRSAGTLNVWMLLGAPSYGSGSYADLTAPTGCATTKLAYFLGSPATLTCTDATYTAATKTLTVPYGTVAASNLTATALATPVITPPIANVLSLLTTVTVVAGASLVDGDYFTLSDGSAVVYEFDNDANVTAGRVGITFTGAESAQAIRDLVVVAINGSTLEATAIAAAADTLTVTSDVAGDTMGVNSENVANAGFLVPAWGEPTHATTYGYKVEACLADGSCAPSAEVTTATGHATLSNANYNSVTWGAVTGASYYKLTRVTGTPAGGDAPPRLLYTGPLLTFQDTNAASTSEAVATGNETGVITAAKFVGPGLGITNSAGANVITKSDGTNLVASALSESGDTFSLGAQTGTNVAGTSKTFVGNLGTGNAASGTIVFQTGVPQASGATQHVAATALTLTNSGTGGTSAPQALLPDGTAAVPSFAWAGSSNSGMYRPNNSRTVFVGNGSKLFGTGLGEFQIDRTTVPSGIGFSPNLFSLSADAFFSSPAAATLQLGKAPNATPVANTLIVGESGSGTNIAGANGIISSGIGTGSGAGSKLIFKTPVVHGSDAVAQTMVTQMEIDSNDGVVVTAITPSQTDTFYSGAAWAQWANVGVSRSVLGSKSKTLTDGSATAFATFTIADGETFAGEVIYKVTMAEGAAGGARQTLAGRVRFAATREGTTYTTVVNEVGTQLLAAAAGTLTGAISIAGTGGVVTLSANFDTSQSGPDVFKIDYRFDSCDAGLAITPL